MMVRSFQYIPEVTIQKCRVNVVSLSPEILRLHDYLFTRENISKLFDLAIAKHRTDESIHVTKLVLKLGVIPEGHFSTLFNRRLTQALEQCLEQLATQTHTQNPQLTHATPDELLTNVGNASEVLKPLAICCLQPVKLLQLLQNGGPQYLRMLLKRLQQGEDQLSSALADNCYSRVTGSRLEIAALGYLLYQAQGNDWLSQHIPTASQVASCAKAIARGEIPPEQVVQLLTCNQPFDSIARGQPACPALVVMRWLLPLWRQPAVRQVIHRLKGRQGVHSLDTYLSRCLQLQGDAMPEEKERPAASRSSMPSGKGGLRAPNTPCSLSQGICNAGVLLLWPLLPQLFSLLGLWAEEHFVSDAARWQAVHCLDRLVRGEPNPTEERLTLNQMLCGVSCSASVPPTTTPLNLLQLQQIDDWLAAIGQQLPGWQKLSLTDIRQLFLQRSGEISTEGAVLQISVWPEPWDFLLRDWPWPMTLASFPWTEQPLTIVWPLNGFTG